MRDTNQKTYKFVRPTIPEPEAWLPFLATAYHQGQFSNYGPVVKQLEQEIAKTYCQSDREAVLVANGTAGLIATLLALNVRGSVVVPAFTFPATAQAVCLAGCTPVFCDVGQDSWELDPEALDKVLASNNVSAVIHVRVYGFCRSLDGIETVVQPFGVPLVVDAAAALGGRVDEVTWTGQSGDAEVFSLHATKVFGIGEGGVVIAPPVLAGRIRRAINFGLMGSQVAMPGFNGKISEFQAAVGLSVLKRLKDFIARRTEIADSYRQAFYDRPGILHPYQPGFPPWQTYPLLLPCGVNMDLLLHTLGEGGLECRRYYNPPLHKTAVWGTNIRLPVTEDLSARMICLPIYSDMTDAEQSDIVTIFRKAIASVIK